MLLHTPILTFYFEVRLYSNIFIINTFLCVINVILKLKCVVLFFKIELILLLFINFMEFPNGCNESCCGSVDITDVM